MAKALEGIKAVLTAVVLVVILQTTGLLGSVRQAGQEAVLNTGILDAGVIPSEDNEDFNYQFAVKDLQGKIVPVEQFRGKVIFLNLWATWCGPCRAEMPTIQKLYDRVGRENMVFVMLSLDRLQDHEKIVAYIQDKSYTFPVYQPSGRLPLQLKVPTIPTTLIISKEGKILRKEVGSTNFNTAKFRNFLQTQAGTTP